MIDKVSKTNVEYWADRMYRDKPYINKIFESWKPLASDCSKKSQEIADEMIQFTVDASNRLKFEIDDVDMKAARKTYSIDKIVSVNNSFILIVFYYNFDQNLGESYGKN